MEILKKSFGFYCCTNGLGHYKRVYEVCKHLVSYYDVTIYCSKVQAQKIGILENAKYVYYQVDNIRWDLVTRGEYDKAIKLYFDWGKVYGESCLQYDTVVSDNLPILLTYRTDIILMGSFLWKDVFLSYIGLNKLTAVDTDLLGKYTPKIITNKYLETLSIKTYNNKVQFGFGCEERMTVLSETKYTILQDPSLPYLDEYTVYLKRLESDFNLVFVENLSYIYDVRLIARPGVGTITHCVEHRIPLIALYSDNDSEEIIELAHIVEDLKIGFKQNINDSLDIYKLKQFNSNTNFCYGQKFEKQGYKKTAEYLKNG